MGRVHHSGDHYATLGIEVTDHISIVSTSMVKHAYRTLALVYHPDKGNVSNDNMFKALNLARETLVDAQKKREYDSWYVNHYRRAYVTAAIIEREKNRRLNNLEETEDPEEVETAEDETFRRHQEESRRKAHEEILRRQAESRKFREQREAISKAQEEYERRAAYEDKIKELFITAELHPSTLTKTDYLRLLETSRRRLRDSIKNYIRLKEQARAAHNRAESMEKRNGRARGAYQDGLGRSDPNRAEARQYEEQAKQMKYTISETGSKFKRLFQQYKRLYTTDTPGQASKSQYVSTQRKAVDSGTSSSKKRKFYTSDSASFDFTDDSDYSDYGEFQPGNETDNVNDKYANFDFNHFN